MHKEEWIQGDGFIMRREVKQEENGLQQKPTKDEQIRALLSGGLATFELATKTLGVKHMVRHSYREVFNVTREDIDAYVRDHGLPKIWCDIPDHIWGQGLEFWQKNGKWYLYWLEKGEWSGLQVFDDEQKAKEALLDFILSMSGTGIDFRKNSNRDST